MKCRILCKQCRNVFDLTISDSSFIDKKVYCPACGSSDVIEAPSWVPLGSGLNIFESNEWEYICQECQHVFKMPIPKSPSEDKNRRCPVCNSNHLHLLTNVGALPIYCG